MLKIIKDIKICYDGIRLISLKENQEFDVKSILPNPEKAAKFKARLIELEAAKETAKKESKEKIAKDTFSEMKKKELQKFLDDAGVEYESDANKPRLIELAREVAIESVDDEGDVLPEIHGE